MADFKHDDQSDLVCEQGAHGTDPEVFPEEVASYYDAANQCAPPPAGGEASSQGQVPSADDQQDWLCSQYSEIPECKGYVASRSKNGEKLVTHVLDKGLEFFVVNFGHLHRYPTAQWEALGPAWQEKLVREGQMLYGTLQMDIANLADYRKICDDQLLVAGTSEMVAQFSDWLKGQPHAKLPEIADFKKLQERAKTTASGLAQSSSLSYTKLLDAGLEYMRIRRVENALNKKFSEHRDVVTSAAEETTNGLVIVESTAFHALDLAAQVYAMGDPIREVAYRLGMVVMHAFANGAGDLSVNGQLANAVRAGFKQVRAEGPNILADAAVNLLCKRLRISTKDRLRNAVKSLVTSLIVSVLDIIDYEIFEQNPKPEEKFKEAGMKLLIGAITDVVVALISPPEGELPAARVAELRKTAAALASSIVNGLLTDLNAARQRAAKEGRSTGSVFIEELPWTIARIVTSAIVGVSRSAMQRQVESEIQQGKTKVARWTLYWDSSGTTGEGNQRVFLTLKKPQAKVAPLKDDELIPTRPALKPRQNRVSKSARRSASVYEGYKRKFIRHTYPEFERLLAKLPSEIQEKTVVLYSGETPTQRRKNAAEAESWADAERQVEYDKNPASPDKRQQYIRIDETSVGLYLLKLQDENPELKGMWTEVFKPYWVKASATLAQNAVGTVVAFDEGATPQGVYRSVELKTLEDRLMNLDAVQNRNLNIIVGRKPELGRGRQTRSELLDPQQFFGSFEHSPADPNDPYADQPTPASISP